ncbi:arginine vasopressin-induced protein 1 isoform X1 [Lissotriton helveticus]
MGWCIMHASRIPFCSPAVLFSSDLMGTPASVVCEPSPTLQVPEPRTRKKGIANIFKGVELLQIQSLFKNNGDESAEDRARIIWEYAGDRRIAEALKHLRRKKNRRVLNRETPVVNSDNVGVLSVQHFSQLCLEDGSYPVCSLKSDSDVGDDEAPPSRDETSGGTRWRPSSQRATRNKRVSTGHDPSIYLHQIRH